MVFLCQLSLSDLIEGEIVMHIYAFGSVCRGEIDLSSDIDLLAVVEGIESRLDPNDYSIYSYSRIEELWKQGNPFAWHLALESKLIFSSDNIDFIYELGKPSDYVSGVDDCKKFQRVFLSACSSLEESELSVIFDFSSIFLGIRNFATCYSLAMIDTPSFSRNSAFKLGVNSLCIEKEAYSLLEKCRILCTRGKGELLTQKEILKVKGSLSKIDEWMTSLNEKIKVGNYE